jgi:DNA-binding transcriptional MerR regulator
VTCTSFLRPADAARRLGVSAKALRLYEERGMICPGRTPAGWRAYGPAEMERARQIIALRQLGLSLSQIARALAGDSDTLAPALAAHQSALEDRMGELSGAIARIHVLRARIAAGEAASIAELASLQSPARHLVAAFDLPWPWGGERFELWDMRAITWIVGPLFSGKTRLAMRLAETIPGAAFIGLERTRENAKHDPRIDQTLSWLIEDGATESDALLALLAVLESGTHSALVIDLIEQGLDEATQLALAAHLRRRGPNARPVFAMTRSSAMLDLAAVGPDETILLCPANHSSPIVVAPHPGAPGFETLASCLAPPDIRARSEGVIAIRQPVPQDMR